MARLLSLNVGLPRDIAWQGKIVHTAIWKEPDQGRRTVRRLNIDGDGQGDLAGHGGEQRAVFIYQIESYRYWESQLGRTDFEYGEFGENFTVEGLSDEEVCIGDHYRIGSALFEVTQPRVTCYRIGIRSEAGDEIVRLMQGPESMTVSEVNALLYKPGHPPDRLERALRIPALSTGWRGSFEALLERTQSTGATSARTGGRSSAGIDGAPPAACDGEDP